MILVYGRPDDPPLIRTLEALQDAGAPYLLLAQTALASEGLRVELVSHGVSGILFIAGQPVPLDRIRSVYARPLELPSRIPDPLGARRARLLHEQLFEWLAGGGALWSKPPP